MHSKTHNGDLDVLNAGLARSRKDMAALAAGLLQLSQWQHVRLHRDGDGEGAQADAGDHSGGRWASLWHGLNVAGRRSRQAASSLSCQIEQHPLVSSLTAFGLGFGIATLLYKRSPGRQRS